MRDEETRLPCGKGRREGQRSGETIDHVALTKKARKVFDATRLTTDTKRRASRTIQQRTGNTDLVLQTNVLKQRSNDEEATRNAAREINDHWRAGGPTVLVYGWQAMRSSLSQSFIGGFAAVTPVSSRSGTTTKWYGLGNSRPANRR